MISILPSLTVLLLMPLALLADADKDREGADASKAGSAEHHFSVRANGVDVPLLETVPGAVCHIELSRPMSMEITADEAIKTVDIRPQSKKIAATYSGRTVRLTLDAPAKLSVEINGDLRHPLFLFADLPETAVDGKAAGVRYFKGGKTHVAGPITLADNQTVYIERGAVVEGWISADNAKNIKILGHGILDASKYAHATSFTRCSHVEINGITIVKDGKGWVNKISLCDHIAFKNIKVIASGEYSDGIDLVGCRDVSIDDVFIRNEDDSIVLKNEKFGFKGNVENILVQNSVIWHGTAGNAIEIGYETTGEFIRNALFKNIDIIRTDTQARKFNRAALSIHSAGNATISNVRYENIRIEAAMEYLFNFQLIDMKKWGTGGGTIKDVYLKDIFLTGGPDAPSVIRGRPSSKLEGFVFENICYKGERISNQEAALKKNFKIDHAEVEWR